MRMGEYVVTTTCVVEANDPVDAAREADIWIRANNSVFTVDDGSRMTEVNLADHEDEDD